ncbi:prepilin-type N-terminal cleavage/methylation domain-containing protein (plasmid) [Skermanella rosea]|uniref:type IV pilus modification PilV family protein n=1 Tax=Skermanella rosea TaxID=1817965 RepID=UPI0019325C44|nr:prepilin-type N-terminal cleavage/methylation domain-containing protein [Skermanella rosea]UEM07191.1 prepilin-type N-terminal cleavage/methylation domain-containing protein [Skermanella rosea]
MFGLSSSARFLGASGRRGAPRGAAPGFTLIETLVAFIILSMALLAALQAFSTSLRGISAAEGTGAAVLHARSKMDEVGITIPLVPGETGGAFADGFRWKAGIEPYPDAYPGEAGTLAVEPYQVSVTVTWGRAQAITLQTVKLGPAR